MRISVKNALRYPGVKYPVQAHWEEPAINMDGPVVFEKPIQFDGQIEGLADSVKLEGTAQTVLRLVCDRCGDVFLTDFVLDVEEEFAGREEDYPITSGFADLKQPVMDNIISGLPIKRLCSAGCKGLCPACGCNRNHETCGC